MPSDVPPAAERRPPAARSPLDRLASFATLLAILAIGAAFLYRDLDRGWVPHDEGALGQAAERVLHGEMPHRDFDDIYTGLLSYLNAAAFRWWGVSVNAMRIPLFGFTLLWLSSVYAIARRFVPVIGAGVVSLVCLAYAVPNYRSPIPSWYVLFFATFGTLALVRWHDTRRRRWLIAAGASGGVAILFKLSGIFYTTGGVLALIAASAPRSVSSTTSVSLKRLRWMGALVLGTGVLVVARVVRVDPINAFFRFVPLVMLVAATMIVTEAQAGGGTARERIASARRVLAPYLFGVAVPLAGFVLPYFVAGGLGFFLSDIFVAPFRRLASAAIQPPQLNQLRWAIPMAWLLWSASRHWRPRLASVAAVAWLGALLLLARSNFHAYRTAWIVVWSVPVLVALSLLDLARIPRTDDSTDVSGAIARTIGIIAVCSTLIEFPFAAPIYTLYALPLSLLALTSLVRVRARVPSWQQMALLAFFMLFGYGVMVPGTIHSLGNFYSPYPETSRLTIPRVRLRVVPKDSASYTALTEFLAEHTEGRTLWAGPDAPEVYFLSGMQNRTRTLFDFLDQPSDTGLTLAARVARISASLIVIKQDAAFSAPVSREELAALQAAFPQQREFANYLVLWR